MAAAIEMPVISGKPCPVMLQPFVQPAPKPPAASPSGAGERSIESCSALAAAGDKAAIAELHDRLSAGLVRHFARKLARSAASAARPDVAEELAQQTWLAFWQAISQRQYDPARAKLSTFLYAIAANMWLRHVRQSGRDARTRPVRIAAADGADATDWPLTGECDDPAQAMHTAAMLDAVRSAVDGTLATKATPEATTFDEPERALLRAIGEGMTDRQLAAELGVSPSTAHARKRGVLTRLALVLRGQGFSGPDVGLTTDETRRNGPMRGREPVPSEQAEHDSTPQRGPKPAHSETTKRRLGAP